MKLKAIDADFIRLVGDDRFEELAASMEGRSERLNTICRMPELDRRRLWRDYGRLWAQVVRGVLRSSPSGARRYVFWDRAAEEHAQCRAWLRRFLGDVEPFGISMKSRIVRGQGFRRTFSLMWGLGRLLSRRDLAESDLASSYVLIARSCLIAGSHAQRSRAEDAYLFLIYRPETPFVAAWLMRGGLRVHQVALTTPLLPHTRAVVADELVLCNPYQVDEVAALSRERSWPPAVLWGPKEIVELEERYGYAERDVEPDVIGLYTQGYRLRVRRGIDLDETGTPQAEHEELLACTLLAYLDTHPDVRLRVFPHPLERRTYLETGAHDLGDLVDHQRVQIDWEGPSSIKRFDDVGIGVMGYSTVGFDRLFMGFPTIFFMPEWLIDRSVESAYQRIFTTAPEELVAALDDARRLTPTQFMSEHFGGPFKAPAPIEPVTR